MRSSDYPPPGYAGLAWYANGRLWLARAGETARYFEDTPDGLNELRTALLACAPARVPVGPAKFSGSNLTDLVSKPKLPKPFKRLTAKGRPKLDAEDLWGEQELASNEEGC